MSEIDKALRGAAMLREQGHCVEFQVCADEKGEIKEGWKVDDDFASTREMEHLADGIYSFEELLELFARRRRDQSRAAGA